MPRTARLEYEGAFYHVMNRGRGRRRIFDTDDDYQAFLETVVQMRLKRSGQHWDDAGGQSILTFRAILRSGQLNDAWEYIKGFYLKPVELPENVVNFPRV